jgi:hypothetical protein
MLSIYYINNVYLCQFLEPIMPFNRLLPGKGKSYVRERTKTAPADRALAQAGQGLETKREFGFE